MSAPACCAKRNDGYGEPLECQRPTHSDTPIKLVRSLFLADLGALQNRFVDSGQAVLDAEVLG
jgi:hypothetical protein